MNLLLVPTTSITNFRMSLQYYLSVSSSASMLLLIGASSAGTRLSNWKAGVLGVLMKTLISARKKEVTFSMQWKQVEQVVTCVSLFNLNVHLISPEDTADKPDLAP